MRLLWLFIMATAAGLSGCTPAGSMNLGGTRQPTTMPQPDPAKQAKPKPALARTEGQPGPRHGPAGRVQAHRHHPHGDHRGADRHRQRVGGDLELPGRAAHKPPAIGEPRQKRHSRGARPRRRLGGPRGSLQANDRPRRPARTSWSPCPTTRSRSFCGKDSPRRPSSPSATTGRCPARTTRPAITCCASRALSTRMTCPRSCSPPCRRCGRARSPPGT